MPKNGVRNIQTARYNGARTVYIKLFNLFQLSRIYNLLYPWYGCEVWIIGVEIINQNGKKYHQNLKKINQYWIFTYVLHKQIIQMIKLILLKNLMWFHFIVNSNRSDFSKNSQFHEQIKNLALVQHICWRSLQAEKLVKVS